MVKLNVPINNMPPHSSKFNFYRRAQIEMIGLVIIVAIVMIGIILYVLSLSKQSSGQDSRDLLLEQKGSAFLTAILDTNVPECNDVTVTTVIQKCAEGKSFCSDPVTNPSGDACLSLQLFLGNITQKSLYDQGSKFNLSLNLTVGEGFSIAYDCNTGAARINRSIRILATPEAEIALDDGTKAKLKLAICK